MMTERHHAIIPAPAGIQKQKALRAFGWTPAFAGKRERTAP
jgi:hypothetical protein